MNIEQAKVYLEMGDDVVLCIDYGTWHNPFTDTVNEPLHLSIILQASDFDPDTFDERMEGLTRGYEYTLTKDTGVGLEVLR
jgi:hypothetical protein